MATTTATSAVLDAYEVLRQLVDDAASLASSLILVLADTSFIDGKSNRSLDAYTALKMRIWDDVKAKRRDNPLDHGNTLAADHARRRTKIFKI